MVLVSVIGLSPDNTHVTLTALGRKPDDVHRAIREVGCCSIIDTMALTVGRDGNTARRYSRYNTNCRDVLEKNQEMLQTM